LNLNPNKSLDDGDVVDFGYKASLHNINYWVNFSKLLCSAAEYDAPMESLKAKFGNKERAVQTKSLFDC